MYNAQTGICPTAAGGDAGLVAVGPEVLENSLHRLVGELRVGLLPARVLGAGKGEYQGDAYDGCEKEW